MILAEATHTAAFSTRISKISRENNVKNVHLKSIFRISDYTQFAVLILCHDSPGRDEMGDYFAILRLT